MKYLSLMFLLFLIGCSDSQQVDLNSIEDIKKKAKKGNVIAQVALGNAYTEGRGVYSNATEATHWYKLAAEQGNAEAQFALANAYAKRKGIRQDHTEAAKWYKLSAEQGNVEAQLALAHVYNEGIGVRQDHAEAAKWYKLAAEQGNAEAQAALGNNYTIEVNSEPLLLPKDQPQIKKIQTETLRVEYKVIDSGYNTSATYIYLISLEDNITINGIIVNRGNCKLFRGENSGLYNSNLPAHFKKAYGNAPAFPVNLKYGQETYFVFNNCPNLLETVIQTNIGEYRYTF